MKNKLPLNITKRIFWRYVNIKIKRAIHHYHVFAVISILFEELLQDLKNFKDINISNFGILSLKETKPRLYHDVTKKQVVLSKKNKILKFKLSGKLKRYFLKKIDVDKTFGSD